MIVSSSIIEALLPFLDVINPDKVRNSLSFCDNHLKRQQPTGRAWPTVSTISDCSKFFYLNFDEVINFETLSTAMSTAQTVKVVMCTSKTKRKKN